MIHVIPISDITVYLKVTINSYKSTKSKTSRKLYNLTKVDFCNGIYKNYNKSQLNIINTQLQALEQGYLNLHYAYINVYNVLYVYLSHAIFRRNIFNSTSSAYFFFKGAKTDI